MRSVISRSLLSAVSRAPRTYSGVRFYTAPPMDEYEEKIYKMLQDSFSPTQLLVKDVSGGCGSMFAISIESSKFKGIPMIKQHRLVNETLKEEIAQWHGLQLQTKSG